ncbi:MAG: DinB family protein [Halofilum sp. (in: g-proteobacteria)]|nr:DinB family protein [Halofilum sp. (in: g-proteobacteria)]
MIDRAYCTTMARYDRSMNERLYALCAGLPDGERRRDLGAFFGSVHATLEHLLWADQVWLSRFTGRPRPAAGLGERLHEDFADLRAVRAQVDAEIEAWAGRVDADWLASTLTWTSGADGATRARPAWVLVVHLFNHQAHHRGQLTTLLTQLGHDYGVTDLPWMPGLADDPA